MTYLDVDEVLAALDDVDVRSVDGLLVVFDAGRPIGGRAKDLRGESEFGREDEKITKTLTHFFLEGSFCVDCSL